MTFSDGQIPAKGATSPDIEFDVLVDDGTQRVTPKLADMAARASLASLDEKAPDLGQALAAESVPVVLTALQLAALAQDLSVVAVKDSLGTDGSAAATLPGGSTGVRGWLRIIYEWLKAVFVTQGSATGGQSGPLMQGATVSADQTYTAGQTNPLTVTPAGRLRVGLSSAGSVVGGTAGSNSDLVGGTYRAAPATLTDGQQAGILLDAAGRLQTRNDDIGAKADGVATSDTGTFSLIALVKRLLSYFAKPATGGTVTGFTATTDTALFGANASRLGLVITNEGAGTLYIRYGAAAVSATDYTFKLGVGDVLTDDEWQGAVHAMFGSAGTARPQELT